MKTFLRVFAIILLANLGFGAVYGGWMLITAPGGEKFGWTVVMLEGTSFNNFLISGIILFIMNGLLSLFIATMVVLKARRYEWFIIIQGCILIGWLTIEILLNSELFEPILHYPSYITGVLLVTIGIILMKSFKPSS